MRILLTVLFGMAIAAAGVWLLSLLARGRPKEEAPPEDVAELDVVFVCGECGTEFRVEKLGELQVPRHCGEPMAVERRRPG